MNTLNNFSDGQVELKQMISDLKIMLQPQQLTVRPNAKTAYETLCSLGKKMKAHLSEGDQGIYPPLLTHDDPKLKSLAWGFIAGEKPLRKQFDDYYSKWLKNCDFNFTEEFLKDTHEVFEAIEARIDHEQSVLIPRLKESGVFNEAQA